MRHSLHRLPLLVVAVSIALSVVAVVSAVEFANGLSTDLAITATAPASADRGQTFLQSITVTNLGPAAAHGVIVSETVPVGLIFDAAASTAACRLEGDKITCSLGTFNDNAARTIAIALRTASQDACTERTFQTNATVKADETDPVPGNNGTVTLSTVIRCVPPPTECSDREDNDRDGLIDGMDPGCASPAGDNEASDRADGNGTISTEERLRLRLLARQGRIVPVPLPPAPVPVPEPFPLPAPAQDPVAVTPSLALDASQDRTEVQPGDTVSFTLTVRNDSGTPVQGAMATLRFDAADIAIRDVQDAVTDAGVVQWTLDLEPGQTRVLRFAADVHSGIAAGRDIAVTATLTGPGVTRQSVMTVAVIGHLPATGAGDFTRPFENIRAFLTPVQAAAVPAIVWAAVVSMGLASGAAAGKKFL